MQLTPTQIEHFSRRGYLVVPQIITTAQIDEFLRETQPLHSQSEYKDQFNLRCRFKTHPKTGAAYLDALDPVVDIAPTARAIAYTPALLRVLEQLLDDHVHLFKDKFILKPPGIPGYPLHQDFITWPFFPESFTTALIAIDASNATNGGLTLYPGSHKKGYLSPKDGDFHDLAEADFSAFEKVCIQLDPGDAVIFGCFLVHGSPLNESHAPRRHLYFSYNKHSDGGEQRQGHYHYFQSWLKKRYSEYGVKNSYFK